MCPMCGKLQRGCSIYRGEMREKDIPCRWISERAFLLTSLRLEGIPLKGKTCRKNDDCSIQHRLRLAARAIYWGRGCVLSATNGRRCTTRAQHDHDDDDACVVTRSPHNFDKTTQHLPLVRSLYLILKTVKGACVR